MNKHKIYMEYINGTSIYSAEYILFNSNNYLYSIYSIILSHFLYFNKVLRIGN